jgi:hypothetical protein
VNRERVKGEDVVVGEEQLIGGKLLVLRLSKAIQRLVVVE